MPETQVAQASILSLVGQSGLVVQLVLLALIFASIYCWSIIFSKYVQMRSANKQNEAFLEFFWKGKTLEEISIRSETLKNCPIAHVFQSGFSEFKKLSEKPMDTQSGMSNLIRSLSKSMQSEISTLEKNLPWLATTASAAPFIGLFGTVWGIMNAFQNIGATGAANLAIVAPGISEALIATAVGLATAIPSVMAYNHYANQIRKIASDVDGFSNDLLNIFQRNLPHSK